MSKRRSVGVIYFVVIILTLLLRVASSLDIYSALGIDDSDVFFSCMVQICIFGVTSVFLYSLGAKSRGETARDVLSDFGVKKMNKTAWLLLLPICVCVMAVSFGISYVWQIALRLMGFTHVSSSTDYSSIGVLFKELVIVAVLPGIFEEIAHRGLLYAGYKECKWRFVLVSALLFSLMHQNIVQSGYTFFFGAMTALMMYYTGSIWGGIFIHFVNNGYSVLSGYASQNGGFLSFITTIENWFYDTQAGNIAGVFGVVACAVLLILFMSILRKRANKEFNLGAPFEPLATDVRPLYKDFMFLLTVAVGVIATAFSFVWGVTR